MYRNNLNAIQMFYIMSLFIQSIGYINGDAQDPLD
jgi:hypothetical protein